MILARNQDVRADQIGGGVEIEPEGVRTGVERCLALYPGEPCGAIGGGKVILGLDPVGAPIVVG